MGLGKVTIVGGIGGFDFVEGTVTGKGLLMGVFGWGNVVFLGLGKVIGGFDLGAVTGTFGVGGTVSFGLGRVMVGSVFIALGIVTNNFGFRIADGVVVTIAIGFDLVTFGMGDAVVTCCVIGLVSPDGNCKRKNCFF